MNYPPNNSSKFSYNTNRSMISETMFSNFTNVSEEKHKSIKINNFENIPKQMGKLNAPKIKNNNNLLENIPKKNYNGMYTYLAKEMPPLISKIDKISYPEVLEKINNNGHSLDPALENMADVSNEEVANLKIKKPFLRFYDKKLEIDYKQYITQGTPKYFLAYLIALFLFWLTDISIEGINNQKVPVYLKLSYMILGLFFFIPYLMENFNRIFPFYLFLLLTFEIIGIYIDKDNNDTRICIQTFVILSFPLYFNSNSFSMMVLLSIYYCIGITPAIYLNEFGFKKETGNEYFLY